jgi:hypothetical protein
MALAPLSAGACRKGFVILTAKPIASNGAKGAAEAQAQDDPAAARALDLDPGPGTGGITLSDEGGQGEGAHSRRSARWLGRQYALAQLRRNG